MSSTLTCWKEIAEYLHKGVRTVQRYERQMGLPVRRPYGKDSGMVLAYSDEVDAWMRSHFQGDGQSDLEVLRKKLADLQKQNKLLHAKLERERAERAVTFIRLNDTSDLTDLMNEIWRLRGSNAIKRSNAIRAQSADLIDLARNLQKVCYLQRQTAQMLSPPSVVN